MDRKLVQSPKASFGAGLQKPRTVRGSPQLTHGDAPTVRGEGQFTFASSIVHPALAGRYPAPGSKTEVVRPFWAINYYETFRGGEVAVIRVLGDGSSDLDVYVYDENGNLIAQDADYGDQCLVRFVPRWAGVFHIRVVNRGAQANLYTIDTN